MLGDILGSCWVEVKLFRATMRGSDILRDVLIALQIEGMLVRVVQGVEYERSVVGRRSSR